MVYEAICKILSKKATDTICFGFKESIGTIASSLIISHPHKYLEICI